MPTPLNRRKLLQTSAASAFGLPLFVRAATLGKEGKTPPSERVTLGFIGCGRQCYQANLPQFLRLPQVQALAVCDVDSWRLEGAVDRIKSLHEAGKAPGSAAPVTPYANYEDLLARDDLDAVVISTPDHWHEPLATAAMKAGKDVALEKPITRTVREGQRLQAAAREHQRIFRVDSEFRSGKPAHWATTLVRNGYLGKLKKVTVCVPQSDVGCPPQPDMPVPPELDYERWQGPAPRAPYTVRRVHPPKAYGRPGWMRHLYYCDGMITNWGTHLNDGAMWATDKERTGPVEIEGTGEYPPADSFWNVLLKFDLRFRFADGLEWTYRTEKPYFVIEGEEGWVRAGFRELSANPKSLLALKLKPEDQSFPLKSEKQDFIDCVRSRTETLEPAEVGHRVTSLGLLGQLAIRLGQKLSWDPVAERFLNSEEANEYLDKPVTSPR